MIQGNFEVNVFDALHPIENRMISIQDYLEYAALAGYQFTRDAPAARCPVCKRAMRNRGGGTQANEHFYHVEDEIFCPTKNPAARPYLNKPPRNPDEQAVEINRQFVAQHLELIYGKMHDLIPYLDFTEFVQVLEERKRLNIYGYGGLVSQYIPYVLVTLMNFLPSKSFQNSRKFKFIFFYDAGIESYEELWIDRGFAADLMRVSYDKSATKKVKKIEVSAAYLHEEPRTLTPKMMKWCLNVM